MDDNQNRQQPGSLGRPPTSLNDVGSLLSRWHHQLESETNFTEDSLKFEEKSCHEISEKIAHYKRELEETAYEKSRLEKETHSSESSIKSVTKQLDQMDNQMKRVLFQMNSLKIERDSIAEIDTEQKDLLAEVENKFQSLTVTSEEKLKALNREIDAFQAKTNLMKRKIEEEVKAMSKELSQLEVREGRLKDEKDRLVETFNRNERELSEAEEHIRNLQDSHHNVNKELATVTAKTSEEETSLNNSLSILNAKSSELMLTKNELTVEKGQQVEKNESLGHDIERNRCQASTLKETSLGLNESIQGKKALLESLHEEYAVKENELEDLVSKDKKVTALNFELEKCLSKIKSLEDERDNVNDRLEGLQNVQKEILSQEEKKIKLDSRILILENKIREYKEKESNLKLSISKLELRLEELDVNERSITTNQFSKQENVDKLTDQLEKYVDKKSILVETGEDLGTQIEDSRKEICSLKKSCEGLETNLAKVLEEMEESTTKTKKLSTQNEQVDISISDTGKKLSEKKNELELCKDANLKKNYELAQLKKINNEMSMKFDQLSSEIDLKTKETSEKAMKDAKDKQDELTKIESEIASLSAELSSISRDIATGEKDVDLVLKEIDLLGRKKLELQSSLKLQEEIESLKMDQKRLKKKVETAVKKRDKVVKQYDKSKATLTKLISDVTVSNESKTKCDQEIESLRSEQESTLSIIHELTLKSKELDEALSTKEGDINKLLNNLKTFDSSSSEHLKNLLAKLQSDEKEYKLILDKKREENIQILKKMIDEKEKSEDKIKEMKKNLDDKQSSYLDFVKLVEDKENELNSLRVKLESAVTNGLDLDRSMANKKASSAHSKKGIFTKSANSTQIPPPLKVQKKSQDKKPEVKLGDIMEVSQSEDGLSD